MSALGRLLVLGIVWLTGAVCARADEGVILFEREGLRPGLCAALRIQLADLTETRCEPDRDSEELSARIAHASARVTDGEARLGVLVERDPDASRVRMYIVSARSDQAVVAIERIQDRPQPDIDRSLALKVRDAYEVVERAASATPSEVAAPPLAAVVAPAPSPARRTYTAWLEAGGGLATGEATRALGVAMLGAGLVTPNLRAEAGVGLRWLSRLRERDATGEVDETERGPALSLRTLWVLGRLELGLALDASMWLSDANGRTSDGVRGGAGRTLWALAPALDARLELFGGASLRLAPALELLTPRQRFAVDQRTLLDVGRMRVIVPLSFVVSLPVRSRR